MPPPPLLGYNNNVRHRRRVFHIQTEDSGVNSPRIMTHLFADGGRIVKSTRTDYSEFLERDDMAAIVKDMMKEQHKAMFVALRSGELDTLIGFDESSPPASVATAQSVLGKAAALLEVGTSTGAGTDRAIAPGSVEVMASGHEPVAPEVAPLGPDEEEVAYAASRPAAIFSVPPPNNHRNIFGQVGLDEKSLDDAILSYLAEEPIVEKDG
jgi:hypothetical protein